MPGPGIPRRGGAARAPSRCRRDARGRGARDAVLPRAGGPVPGWAVTPARRRRGGWRGRRRARRRWLRDALGREEVLEEEERGGRDRGERLRAALLAIDERCGSDDLHPARARRLDG